MNAKIQEFSQLLKQEGIDAFLAQTPVTMGYFTGFFEDGHERFLTLAIRNTGETCLICPALSQIQAERLGLPNILAWKDGEDYLELFDQLSTDWNLESAILVIDDAMPAKMLLEMQSVLPAALFKPGGELMGLQVGVKTDEELELMRRAGNIVDEVYESLLEWIHEGLTEIEVQNWMEDQMKSKGGTPSFCSVCFGANAAESHHLNDDTRLTMPQLVLVDFGCSYQRYQSDITRVFAIGAATPEQVKHYQAVYAAHQAAIEGVTEGSTPSQMDAAARASLAKHGLDQFFTHRTGHGIGMQVHESPNISSANHVPLKSGNCFSIEPGVYLPGKHGVRLENLYYCTPDGVQSFNRPIEPEIRIVTR